MAPGIKGTTPLMVFYVGRGPFAKSLTKTKVPMLVKFRHEISIGLTNESSFSLVQLDGASSWSNDGYVGIWGKGRPGSAYPTPPQAHPVTKYMFSTNMPGANCCRTKCQRREETSILGADAARYKK